MTDLLTVSQAAKALKVSRQTVYLMVWSGDIATRYVLGRIGVPLAEVDRINQLRRENRRKRRNGHKAKKAA